MAVIFINSDDLEAMKKKIKIAQHNLDDEMKTLSPDTLDVKRLSDTSATYEALSGQLGKVVKDINFTSEWCGNLMKYIDEVIEKYSKTDRSLANSVGGSQQG